MRGDPQQLLAALLLPSCGLEEEVLPANAFRYLKLLGGAREHRAQVGLTHTHARTGGNSDSFTPV